MKKPDVTDNRHAPWCEVRTNEDGSLDEIVTEQIDSFHLEQMDDGCWWLGIYRGTERQVVWLNSKKPITANTYEDS